MRNVVSGRTARLCKSRKQDELNGYIRERFNCPYRLKCDCFDAISVRTYSDKVQLLVSCEQTKRSHASGKGTLTVKQRSAIENSVRSQPLAVGSQVRSPPPLALSPASRVSPPPSGLGALTPPPRPRCSLPVPRLSPPSFCLGYQFHGCVTFMSLATPAMYIHSEILNSEIFVISEPSQSFRILI